MDLVLSSAIGTVRHDRLHVDPSVVTGRTAEGLERFTVWQSSGYGTSNGIEQGPKLVDESFKGGQVASDTGQDDGSLQGGDDQQSETVGALGRHADFVGSSPGQ